MTATDTTDATFLSATELAAAYRRRSLSPVEVTDAVLDRIDRLDPQLRAFITVTADLARAQAREAESRLAAGDTGLMVGVPLAIKDNVAVAGVRTTCASAVDPDWGTDREAESVRRLRAAGAVIVGKANLYEYAFSLSDAYPQPINPWNAAKWSAGSSSGSAVAVAAGLAHVAVGSDTGGSGRHPASANGVVGLKGTYGRVSRSGVFPLSWSLDHVTSLGRRVADAATLLEVMSEDGVRGDALLARIGGSLTGMRIARARGFSTDGVDPEVTAVVDEAVRVFTDLGAVIEDVALPGVDLAAGILGSIMLPEAAVIHRRAHRSSPELLGEAAIARLDLGSAIPATEYVRAQQARLALADEYERLFERYDAIVGPGNATRAGDAGGWISRVDGVEYDLRQTGPEYTGIYNIVGNPAIVLPAGFSSEGTPIGLQIAGRWWDEATLVQIGHAFERETPWHLRRPPLAS
jgi:Asp-tRNA(Asn)/Glu-tRNA(Gln) amidotransferase A subunit family amidase